MHKPGIGHNVAGITVDVEVHLAFCNGRDVTPSLKDPINAEHAVEAGDVVALSGPVPYSWGYGAPVV
jgi:hypothetical protein